MWIQDQVYVGQCEVEFVQLLLLFKRSKNYYSEIKYEISDSRSSLDSF